MINYQLISKLEMYKSLLSENQELETMIKPQSSFPTSNGTTYKKRSFMRYFWPYLIGAIGGGYVIYLITCVMVVYSSPTSRTTDEMVVSMLGDFFGGIIAAIVVAVGIIIFGITVSKRKQRDFNSNADFMNTAETEKYKQGVQNQRMIDIYQENITRMHQYENLLPEEHRNIESVNAIIAILNDEKAQTVEEALALLG